MISDKSYSYSELLDLLKSDDQKVFAEIYGRLGRGFTDMR